MHEGQLLLFTGLLLAAGLAASLAAGRLRLPGLVLVLGLGMLIGSDGLGWIAFDDYELARTILARYAVGAVKQMVARCLAIATGRSSGSPRSARGCPNSRCGTARTSGRTPPSSRSSAAPTSPQT